jgi:hypothetical protein
MGTKAAAAQSLRLRCKISPGDGPEPPFGDEEWRPKHIGAAAGSCHFRK